MDMVSSLFMVLADLGIMGPGTQTPGTPADAVPIAAPIGDAVAAAPPPDPGFFGGWGSLIMIGGIFLVMYFLMIRPQRKREKKLKEMQSAITAGDYVVTNAGLFGKVAGVGEDCFIVEFGTNRNIRIPVLKSEVIGIREPKMTPQIIDAPAEKD
jgi:preprotein translocase subunit YajC